MKPRIIVCGLGRTGYKIFRLLRQQGATVVGISDRPLRGEGSEIIIGNFRSASTLLAAGIQSAHTLILTGKDESVNLGVLMLARILNPKIRIINRLFNTSLGDRLDHTLADHTSMSVSALAAPVFAFAALGNHAIGQLQMYNQTWPMHEELIDHNHPWVDRKLSSLWDDRDLMLIYYIPVGDPIDLISAVVQERELKVGDRVIIASKPSVRNRRQNLIHSLFRIFGRLRQFQRHSKSAVILNLALLVTVLVCTITYISINLNNSFVDSLYFTVGMITGAGGNEKIAEQAPGSIKIFTSIMMLVGTAIVGICYALLNDFVLGTRFQEYWDAARIPVRNHYIICGFGGIGLHIAEQLIASGYEVVIIEPDPKCRFLNIARSMKIPVIEGDASLSSTLEVANIEKAEALLAVTGNDIINLEIALSAKGLMPKVSVVVRNQDPHLALMVQQVFEFESVLSPTELAAPAFAAAAIGGRILGNGITADSLWVALATLITPGHPFCGKVTKNVAHSADFVPLYIESNGKDIHGWDLLSATLNSGDVLYLTMPANRLDKLWRNASIQLMSNVVE
ncbi:MAG: NAD-binding protein [Trichodesmium sp. St16_bin4-tuft]|nr:NAD-binding protein [Trichodesmium sp. MAG_R01]MDE5068950.1 NAD-binding protein [Trichodesmium sp. St4_bin8_1]MDE5072464.1 NAD-binding protein [Trichodesmium sp. St5_bin8]MDE5079579.1 NAD-binding protein [Trichodesmium sp. St2_bin6]MDE5090802.1 NAD-binding protein [Trichodesmium sp. St18_bin3_1_1]MDE5099370.1 NAD-binding protein [Trichodesmium sp. St16_bin4-tuft]MDE5102829.1 NAD-binding protein [Trichodesmium sp. St19_bin2]